MLVLLSALIRDKTNFYSKGKLQNLTTSQCAEKKKENVDHSAPCGTFCISFLDSC